MAVDLLGHSPNGMGLATTAVLAALFEVLIRKGVLERSEVIEILKEARSDLSPNLSIASVADAMNILAKVTNRFEQNV